ncbi:MAG: hypothetical protein AAF741_09545 [Bacteroidota bacterium]
MKSLPKFVVPLLLLLLTTCSRDQRESLFEITYDPIEFTFPTGLASVESFVVSRNPVESRFDQAIASANVNLDQVDEVGGLFARLTALSADDFRQLRRAELRICPVGQAQGCTEFDLLFSVDDLFGRRDQVIRLNPSLRNFKELVSSGQFQFELVLRPGERTSTNIQCRLEWGIRGVGVD